MTADRELGDAAAGTLRCMNDFLRTGETTLYAGSLAADVYAAPGEIAVRGAQYYTLNEASRRRYPDPPASPDIPVGANFALDQALLLYLRAFHDAEMVEAMSRSAAALLQSGFEEDGTARRALGHAGTGNLRDQADAGSGLLAYHAVSGDPAALTAAERVAREMARQFWDEKERAFRSVSANADLPDFLREAPPDPAWNGIALRFLAEWSAVSGENRWRDSVLASLSAWANRIPVDGRGAGEIGRAALRAERPLPLLLLVADPSSPEGATLRDLALRLYDPLLLVRWVDPKHADDARRFGVEPSGDPAIYLVWGGPSGPIRDADALREVFDRVRRRVRE
jgi:uncharacterized protein YyaL (SSP411 family)